MDYRHGTHTVFIMHLHLVWITKYRKRVLTGEVAVRVRDIVRELCRRDEVEILWGHVSSNPVHLFVSVPPDVTISRLVQRLKGKISYHAAAGICPSAESVLGPAFVGPRVLLLQQRQCDGRGDQGVHREPSRTTRTCDFRVEGEAAQQGGPPKPSA